MYAPLYLVVDMMIGSCSDSKELSVIELALCSGIFYSQGGAVVPRKSVTC